MSVTQPPKTILSDPGFRILIAKTLKLTNPQYKHAVNEDIKALAKTIFSQPATYTGINWGEEDPFRWFASLQRQAQQLTYSKPAPPMMHNQQNSGFVPINMGSTSGSGLGGPAAGKRAAGGLNVFSNTQFPPLGSAPPPPPPPPPATSSSNHNVANNTGTTPKQKKRKNTSLFPPSSASSTSFDVSEEERLAKMKRARRFEREMELDKKREMGFGGEDDDNDGMGMKVDLALARMGRGKKKRNGRDWFAGAAAFEEEEPEADPNVINWDRYTIKGTSTNIEKSYLRLTSAPNPANIRPLHILQQSLENIRRKWDKNEKEYPWICDQLKSMRQDLTVQRIKNDFTVKVYEFHARVALLSGDLGEYNQCQSVLKQLYEHGLPGCPAEFLGYRILYMIHTKNMSELGRAIARLSSSQKKDPGIHHALAVHTAVTTGNYHKLFQLFVKPVNLNADLMDHFVERERVAALAKISKSYMTIPFGFLARELGFTGDPDHRNHLELCQLLETHDASIFSTSTAKYTIDQAFYAEGMQRPIDWESLEALVWNCKANAGACETAVAKYKKVDIKGQK